MLYNPEDSGMIGESIKEPRKVKRVLDLPKYRPTVFPTLRCVRLVLTIARRRIICGYQFLAKSMQTCDLNLSKSAETALVSRVTSSLPGPPGRTPPLPCDRLTQSPRIGLLQRRSASRAGLTASQSPSPSYSSSATVTNCLRLRPRRAAVALALRIAFPGFPALSLWHPYCHKQRRPGLTGTDLNSG